jgi:hypothetical protein
VKPKLRRQLQRGKQKILQRLAPLIGGTEPRQHGTPEFHGPQPTYELAERTAAVGCGGLGVIHRLVRRIRLPQLLDSRLHARSLTVRLLAWRPELPLLFRFLDAW